MSNLTNITSRNLRRGNNLNPNSTKISKHTEAGKEGQPGYRKNRFNKVKS